MGKWVCIKDINVPKFLSIDGNCPTKKGQTVEDEQINWLIGYGVKEDYILKHFVRTDFVEKWRTKRAKAT